MPDTLIGPSPPAPATGLPPGASPLQDSCPDAERQLQALLAGAGSDPHEVLATDPAGLSSEDRAMLILHLAESGGLFQPTEDKKEGVRLLQWLDHHDPALSFLAELIERESIIVPRLGGLLHFITRATADGSLRRDLIETLLDLYGQVGVHAPEMARLYRAAMAERPEDFSPLAREIIATWPTEKTSETAAASAKEISPAPPGEDAVIDLLEISGDENALTVRFAGEGRRRAGRYLEQRALALDKARRRVLLLVAGVHLVWLVLLVLRLPGIHLPELLLALGLAAPLFSLAVITRRLTPHTGLCLGEGTTQLLLFAVGVPGWPWPLLLPLLAWKLAQGFDRGNRRAWERLQFAAALIASFSGVDSADCWQLELSPRAGNSWLSLESGQGQLVMDDRPDPLHPDDFARLIIRARGSMSIHGEKGLYFQPGPRPEDGFFAAADAVYSPANQVAAAELARLFRF